ncbi:CBO0543 family protein [Ammoniphilus sp. YIM 78166]|uniref:CBO0543 family protein n=1 Tax=Ammoniphilus sp. YIM 78166 TaxID=1644106 RepID=UPI00106FA81E|nr:CBO0543 family protein [Ammoniphilus sp. YIM 78166]
MEVVYEESLLRVRELQDQLVQLDVERWSLYAFQAWNWWLLVVFLIVPWIIWIKLVDKKRVVEILLFGMVIILITVNLDSLGTHLGFWLYPVKLIPIIPKSLPFDASVVPVAYMLIYQYFRSWKSYTLALVVMAIVYAFFGEPLAHWLDQALYLKWRYTYSFFFYIVTGIAVKWAVDKLVKLAKE